jgi:hypothetical protein
MREMMKTLATLLLLATVASTANLSGVWTGAFRGGDSDIPQVFTLKQESTKLTGTGGPDSTERYPVLNGSVTDDVVKFEVNNGQRTFFYDLKSRGKKLSGSLTIKGANDTRTTTVWLERTH